MFARLITTILIAGISLFIAYNAASQQPLPDFKNIKNSFRVYQNTPVNFKKNIIVDKIDFPLDEKEACVVAQKACGVAKCDKVESVANMSSDWLHAYQSSLGKFNWVVSLGPVCGDFTAFINDMDYTVVCFCAYE